LLSPGNRDVIALLSASEPPPVDAVLSTTGRLRWLLSTSKLR
jgi:hypothetical protein